MDASYIKIRGTVYHLSLFRDVILFTTGERRQEQIYVVKNIMDGCAPGVRRDDAITVLHKLEKDAYANRRQAKNVSENPC